LTRRAATTDFASATMVRVLLRGMELLGMRKPLLLEFPNQATVPLDLKRAIVAAAVEQGGLASLPLLGKGVHEFAMEPTHLALTTGRSAHSLFVRWQRLERYIHSRHRILLQEITEHSARIVHIHRDNGPPPLLAEDLVVYGVLCALLEANGLDQVKAHLADTEVYPNPQSTFDVSNKCRKISLRLEWESPQIKAKSGELSVSWNQVAPQRWSVLARAVGDIIASHFPEQLPIIKASNYFGLSLRTFQRELASEGLTYTNLVSEVRFRLAGWYLINTKIPIAEVGFLCGYSDQAHLSRNLNCRVGLSPSKYRKNFAST